MKKTISLVLALLLLLGTLTVGIAAIANAAPRCGWRTAAFARSACPFYDGTCPNTASVCPFAADDRCAYCPQAEDAEEIAYVCVDSLSVYRSRGRRARLLTTLEKGAEVTILTRYGSGWTKVQSGDVVGYCDIDGLTLTAEDSET